MYISRNKVFYSLFLLGFPKTKTTRELENFLAMFFVFHEEHDTLWRFFLRGASKNVMI